MWKIKQEKLILSYTLILIEIKKNPTETTNKTSKRMAVQKILYVTCRRKNYSNKILRLLSNVT